MLNSHQTQIQLVGKLRSQRICLSIFFTIYQQFYSSLDKTSMVKNLRFLRLSRDIHNRSRSAPFSTSLAYCFYTSDRLGTQFFRQNYLLLTLLLSFITDAFLRYTNHLDYRKVHFLNQVYIYYKLGRSCYFRKLQISFSPFHMWCNFQDFHGGLRKISKMFQSK